MLKSTSNAYINKAIEVLKEEQLKGRGEECLKIIEKIFYSAQ
jgi:glutamyl-tRNA reductase